jgi:diguanylate cyclase (GGDEF)-like protein
MPSTSLDRSVSLPSAFAAACRMARSDSELFERCRQALTRRFEGESIWLQIHREGSRPERIGGPDGFESAIEVSRCGSGSTQVAVLTSPDLAATVAPEAGVVALGLALVLELRAVIQDRQAQLDDAVFQLGALRQVARLLSSVHSTEETEHLVLDFMSEVFFATWACLYRPAGGVYAAKLHRSSQPGIVLRPIETARVEAALPLGSPVTDAPESGLADQVPAGAELILPIDTREERLAVLVLGPRINQMPYGQKERDLAATLSFTAAMALHNAELVSRLNSEATTDTLTGLPNRRALEMRLEAELSRGVRHQFRTTVALIDVDHFKLVNDTQGHAAGDRYLTMIGQALSQHVRALDVVGRWGGDEFLVILTMTSVGEALTFVDRLQTGVQEIASRHAEYHTATLSFGLAEAPRHGRTAAALLAAADAALYAAKHGGRNRVEIARET